MVKQPADYENKRDPAVFNLTAAETISVLSGIDSAECEFTDRAEWRRSVAAGTPRRGEGSANLISFLHSMAEASTAAGLPDDRPQQNQSFRVWLYSLNAIARRIVEGYAQAFFKAIVKKAHDGLTCKPSNIDEFMRSPGRISNALMIGAIEKGLHSALYEYLRKLELDTDLFGEPKLDAKRLRSAYRKREELPDPRRPANDPVNLRRKPVSLRCSIEIKNAIDGAVRKAPKTRNDWLNEAIEEKLLREHPELLLGEKSKPSA